MKKITFMFFLVCFSLSAFSARYLINSSTTSWADPTASGGTAVTLTGSLDEWFNQDPMILVAGDEVWLAAGTYTLLADLVLKDGVNLYGSFAGTETAVSGRAVGADPWLFTNQTIIDGGFGLGTAPAATTATRVDGLKFTYSAEFAMGTVGTSYVIANCISEKGRIVITDAQLISSYFTGRSTSSPVQAHTGANLLIKGCKFENNTSTGNGGGMVVSENTIEPIVSDGTIEDCIFTGNTAVQGGGMLVSVNTANGPDSVRIVNCQFLNNTGTHTAAAGGGLMITQANTRAIVDKCSFIGNTTPTLNTTATNGGQGSALAINFSKVDIRNSFFRENTSYKNATIHGNNAFWVRISNCVIVNNYVEATGGSIILLAHNTSTGAEIYNTTIANNESKGTAINFGTVTTGRILKNNLVFGNGSTYNTTAIVTADFNAYDLTPPTNEGISSITLTGTSADHFVLPTSFAGLPDGEVEKAASAAADWSIKRDSPAKDAGTDLSAFGIIKDILGVSRPRYAAFDIGAYEVDYPTGEKNIQQNRLRVFPTITQGIINIEQEVKAIHLYDLNGRTVGKWFNTNQIDISSKPSGVYLLQLKNSDGKIMNYKIGKE